MSRQSNSKSNVISTGFLLIIISMSIPFHSFDIPLTPNIEISSNFQIANFFLGNGLVGKSIFDPNTYTPQQVAHAEIQVAHAEIQEAYAMEMSGDGNPLFTNATYQTLEDADPINDVEIGRHLASEVIQTGERTFKTTNKAIWIDDGGEIVERIVTDDVNGVKFESGSFTYYYDKESCGMTIYDVGKVVSGEEPLIKFDGWVAKSALNGTDNWIDLPQSFLSCIVTVIDNSEETLITSVKQDSNGIMTETYSIPKPLASMKTTVSFFNNNTSLNDHKIAFTNILDAVPENYRFMLMDTMYEGEGQEDSIKFHDHPPIPTQVPYWDNMNLGGVFGNDTTTLYNYTEPYTCCLINFTGYNMMGGYVEDFQVPYNYTSWEYPQIFEFTSSIPSIPDAYDEANVIVIGNEHNVSRDQLFYKETSYLDGWFASDEGWDNYNATMWHTNGTTFEHPAVAPYVPLEQLTSDGFTMDYYSEEYQKVIPLRYKFVNDAIDKLWNIKIVNGQPLGNDYNSIYIDYMNINEITPVGSTTTLDPTTTTPLNPYYLAQYNSPQSGSYPHSDAHKCQNAPTLAFTNDFIVRNDGTYGDVIGGGGAMPSLGNRDGNGCKNVVHMIDITAIPDTATVVGLELEWNIITRSGFENNGGSVSDVGWRNRWAIGNAEDVTFLNGEDGGSTIFNCYSCTGGTDLFAENVVGGTIQDLGRTTGLFLTGADVNSLSGSVGNGTGIHSVTPVVDPDGGGINSRTDYVETMLESGKNYITITSCGMASFLSSLMQADACGVDSSGGGNSGGSKSAWSLWTEWEADFLEFSIEWEIFLPASAPQLLTCESLSPTELLLDWETPSFLGGGTLTGYQVERSTDGGLSFQIIEAGIPALPTDYTDNTVFEGVSFTYRISALNDAGAGAFAEISCGVASTSDFIVDLFAQNQALGIVALDWTEPTFTGNTPIVGYKIDRTTGTPQNVPQEWNVNVQSINTLGCNKGTDFSFVHEQSDLIDQSSAGTGYCNVAFWAVFDRAEIEGKTFTINWKSSGGAYGAQTGGDYTGAFVRVYDGALKGGQNGDLNVNFKSWTGGDPSFIDIEPQVDTTGDGLVDTGFGIIQSVIYHNVGFGSLLEESAIIDTSLASEEQVTLVIMTRDHDGNTGTGGAINTQIDFWELGGIAFWKGGIPQGNFGATGGICNGIYCPSTHLIGSTHIFDDDTVSPLPPAGFIPSPDGFFTLVNDTGNTQTEYLDTTVVETETYGYRVFSYNEVGISESSNIAQVTTAGSPSAPELTATPTGTQTINVDWETPELNGGNIVGYEFERKIGVAGIYSFLDQVVPTELDDGAGLFTLNSATEYCYRAKTITNVGESAFSNEVCATTFDAPTEVENLIATALDGSSVNMSFETPLSDGGSPITGYKVERRIGVGAYTTLDTLTQTQFRNDTGLPIGTLITYRVSASNQYGFGDTETAGDTTDATPQVPQNFVCSASTPDSINLSWTTPVTFSPPTGYQVSRNSDGGAYSVIVADTASTGTTYNDGSLSIDTIYGYKILAHTPEGDTLLTSEVFCQTLKQPDAPPENFKADFSLLAPHTVTLTWDTPNTFGVPITSITVERDDGAGYNVLTVLQSNAVGMIDDNPNNSVDQKYRVKLTGELGDSKYGFAIQSTLDRISHFNFEKTILDSGDQKNSATVSGIVNFTETGHAGTRGFEYNGASYIIVDVAQESDYDFDRLTEFGTTLYYEGTDATGQQALVTKGSTLSSIGWFLYLDNGIPTFRMNGATQSLEVQSTANVTDGSLHFVGFTSTNGTASGVEMMVDGVTTAKNVITDTLSSESILNNIALTFGATGTGTNILQSITDEISIFGETLDEDELENLSLDQIETIAPINATITLTGTTFADVSGEEATITLISGYPIPAIDGVIQLLNYSATTVNTLPSQVIPTSGVLSLPAMFNTMGSTSNYTTIVTLNNGLEVFLVLSNEDIQNPLFSLPDGIDFFFQHARDPTFSVLSFNFTRSSIPFDLHCNLKSELFADGVTHPYGSVGFIQALWNVPPTKDVVVACIDPNSPSLNPDEPSFGGSNALLTFVSFGDTSGIGAFLNFTDNYGDFFGAPVPFLFIILVAALFTGRSAPTGIIIVGITIGIMWYLEILVIDPILWGVIVVLVVLGAIGGKKFL